MYFRIKYEQPGNGKKILYILDHWTGQTDEELYSAFTENDIPDMERIFVPPKLTGTCQPLDTYFNRQLKYLTKKIYGHSALHIEEGGKENRLVDRNNIIKLQSSLHFQLSAPLFIPMIKYSWVLAGLLDF